ncbi:MAG: hypothetical protein VXW87_05170 [Pseudomonadota bacterium]|nr:hypothetical protein [Pseudomonadota bacterium]
MDYQAFIEQLKQLPTGVMYHNLQSHSGEISEENRMKFIRDALVDVVVADVISKNILHQEASLHALLEAIGLSLTIEETLKDQQERHKVIVDSLDTSEGQSTSVSFLLNWQQANIAAFRTITTLVEHQMQKYLLAVEKATQILNNIDPKINQLIADRYSHINIITFTRDLVTISNHLQNDPEFFDAAQKLYQQPMNDTVHPGHDTFKDTCRHKIQNALGYIPEETNMWLDLFSNIDAAVIKNAQQHTDAINNVQLLAEEALAPPKPLPPEATASTTPPEPNRGNGNRPS